MGGDQDVELLTGSMTKAQRTEPLSRLAIGEAGIVIGTHALLEEQVQFFDLGLVVVDEQHRFGVEQRAALTDKAGTPPHVLVMTATPIPRTVAMTVFGDLEVSTLTELPAGRAPIQTNVVPLAEQPAWIDRVWQRVREEVEQGPPGLRRLPADHRRRARAGRASTRRSDDDVGAEERRAADDLAARARSRRWSPSSPRAPLAGLRVATLHGRMPPDEKDRTMRAFAAGEIDVLVSTTVIEVGVDVANATTMVLMDADRFGISQLHQLRGRVGRGGLPGLCLLVTQRRGRQPTRATGSTPSPRTTDGFELSRVDLEQRREGDVLGRSQSGYRSTPAEPPRAPRRGHDRRGPRGRRGAARRRRRPWPATRCWPRAVAGDGGLGARASSWRSREVTRDDADHRGQRRRPPDHARPPDSTPGRPPTGCARRCSPASRRGAARCRGCASSTSTPARARSASRRGRAAPGWSPWSSRTGAPPG